MVPRDNMEPFAKRSDPLPPVHVLDPHRARQRPDREPLC